MIPIVVLAVAWLAGLAVAAFFAASDAAFFRLSAPTGHDVPEPGTRVGRLRERPERLQGALELGHLLGVAWAGALAWALARQLIGAPPGIPWVVATLVVAAFAALVLAELVPKAAGMERSAAWARRTGPVVSVWSAALTPVIALGEGIYRLAERLLPAVRETAPPAEELRSIVTETTERSDLEVGERQMITSIFAFAETYAREVMTPRPDVVGIEAGTPWDEVVDRVRDSEHSRVPVYRDSLDDVIGILYAKDLLGIVHGPTPPPRRLEEILRESAFVPEAKRIDDVLRQFQREQTHLAVVVDEYGGMAGIVTLEDILEELVGEIQDEYDHEEPMVVPLERGVLRLDGRLDADDFNELTGSDLEVVEVETMGGLVARELGRVAEGGERVVVGEWEFEVESVEGKRIARLLAWPMEERPEDGGER